MRQIWIMEPGPPDVLQVRQAPIPTPGPGEIRIAVEAVGVNFADIVGRLGIYRDAPPTPYIPGYEVAGTVDAVGPGVESLQAGDPVVAGTYFGGYSESICVPAAFAFKRPDTLTAIQVAGFPVPFLAAYEALVALARVQQGDHVLIHAAAGGLGLACVAIAKRFGATIYGTASPGKHAFLLTRGVQHPIDYRHKDFEHEIAQLSHGRGVDIVVDSISGHSWAKSYRALAPAGKLILCGMTSAAPGMQRSWLALARFALTTPWLMFNPARLTSDNKAVMGINVAKLWTQPDLLRGWAETVLGWVAAGEIDVHVDRTFPFEAAADAHRYIQSRQNTGKVVLVTS
jgi:NADPH:quinone reductase-like Zn-dependent oxidoreductase